MLGNLRLAKYRFTLLPTTSLQLHQFVGSTLRGAFGGVFRRLVCVTGAATCEDCLLRNQCAYGYVFETTPPAGSEKLRNLSDIPRPFVIEPPTSRGGEEEGPPSPTSPPPYLTFAPGDPFSFNLTLVGRAIDYLPYFIFVFRELEKRGIGRGRQEGQGQFQLHQVTALCPDGSAPVLYDRARDQLTDADVTITEPHILARAHQLSQRSQRSHPPTLTLHFLTPTRLKFAGHLTSDFQFHHLVRALLRRLSGLIYFHCGGVLDVDFRGLIERAQAVEKVGDALRWQEQTRYSARQKTEMQMGGFVGAVTFAGDFAPFLPLLAAGEWTHVGKGCVMGLGRYQIGESGN